MAKTSSPLRYPGGKTSLYPLVSYMIKLNGLEKGAYFEPYAGGAGLALSLLFSGQVSEIFINDVDERMWAFWYAILNEHDLFIEMIREVSVDVNEWYRQRQIYFDSDLNNPLSLGFATFFLNRTNRSGIIQSGGMIGGVEQRSRYRIDCRFNKDDLIRRIRCISRYRDRIYLYGIDASRFLSLPPSLNYERKIVFLDPPYFQNGAKLYRNFYNEKDHWLLADALREMDCPWILTYDDCSKVREIYEDLAVYSFKIRYTAQEKRKGGEILIIRDDMRVPVGLGDQGGG